MKLTDTFDFDRYFLERVSWGWRLDRHDDASTKRRMVSRGLVRFDRADWRWRLTKAGRRALAETAGEE